MGTVPRQPSLPAPRESMDFFAAQDAARRRTALLIGLFLASVAAIIAVVYLFLHFTIRPSAGFDAGMFFGSAAGVLLLVGAGSVVRIASLSQGGPAVAQLLGGRWILPDSSDPDERRLLNVVEEMAIASGTPVPAVYVLDREDGINAFAAGYTTHDAAVAVTRGALRSLTRDELQGVIAHEFSHILNGDMRLNVRLIGVLHGILLLAIVGREIARYGPRSTGRRGRRESSGSWIVLFGFTLFLVGYIGVFFGKLIKAAVSREREFLADAAAVQFTRNPRGLAGALRKIAADVRGSRIEHHRAEEASHLFFANGLADMLFGFLATHPPLEERIRRLDPGGAAEYDRLDGVDGNQPASMAEDIAAAVPPASIRRRSGQMIPQSVTESIEAIGAPTPESLAGAAAFLEGLPPALADAHRDGRGAVALLFALLAAECEPEGTERAAEVIRGYGGAELEERIGRLAPLIRERGRDGRLPLLDLAIATLRSLSPDQGSRLLKAVEDVVIADGRLRLFEFTMVHTLGRRLAGPDEEDRHGGRFGSFDQLGPETATLLSALSWTGAGWDRHAAQLAFEAAVHRLPSDAQAVALTERTTVSLEAVDQALSAFRHATPGVRRRLLEACAEAVIRDGRIERVELELLRAIAEALDCPMPPLIT